jgi:type IV pilus assembly protein PilV
MDRQKPYRDARLGSVPGFTLIEVMIALTIFSVGLLAVYSMQISSIKGNSLARASTENMNAAVAKVEQLMSLPYEHDLLVDADADVAVSTRYTATQTGDGIDNDLDGKVDLGDLAENGFFTLEWWVNDNCLGLDFEGHKCIEVRVSSTIDGPRPRPIRLNFIKANLM